MAAAGLLVGWAGGCSAPDRWARFDAERVYGDLTLLDLEQDGAEPVSSDPGPTLTVDESGDLVISVEDAVLTALANNRDLRVQRFTPAITATFEDIERGVFDPELYAQADILEEESVEVSRATGENFPAEREDTNYAAGVRQRLPTGTDIDFGVTSGRSVSNRSPEQQSARVGLTVTQSLLRGFGPAVNLASVRQAYLDTVASRYELRAFAESLLAETETTYWNFTLAERRIAIFENSLQIAERQQQEVDERVEIGVLASTDRASAAAETAQRRQDLIDARAGLEVLRLRLLRLMSPGADGRLDRVVKATSDPATEPAPVDDLEDRVDLAVRSRPELGESRARLDSARLETIVTKNGLLPRLDFFVTLGKTGYADSFSQAFRELDGDTFDAAAGVDLSVPLGNRVARAADRAAVLSRRQAAEAVANLEQLVRLDVRLAAAEAERARQQISASAVTRALREEALRAEEERFRVGTSTSLLVAQAQRDLLESQIAEVEAVVAYRVALIELYRSEGTLLERRGLTVPE